MACGIFCPLDHYVPGKKLLEIKSVSHKIQSNSKICKIK